ncbi:arylacetamide deacetylase-like isoform X3 [Rhinolophus sinicus]|uniref:arylacetamide deacetylase-like isoform X3 n=1 Tax=Rhinolophus sinicus TaxID=89399 RepID=UPI003D7BE6A9
MLGLHHYMESMMFFISFEDVPSTSNGNVTIMTHCQGGRQTDLRQSSHQPILESCGVDPGRVGISGDSAGGNLGAAVTQQAKFVELLLGLKHFADSLKILLSFNEVPPTSDENVTDCENFQLHPCLWIYATGSQKH